MDYMGSYVPNTSRNRADDYPDKIFLESLVGKFPLGGFAKLYFYFVTIFTGASREGTINLH